MSLAPVPPTTPLPHNSPFLLLFFPAYTAQVKSRAQPGPAPHSLPRLSPPPCAPPPAPRPLLPSRLLPSLAAPRLPLGTLRPGLSPECAPSRSASLPSAPAQTAGGGTVAAALQIQPLTAAGQKGPPQEQNQPRFRRVPQDPPTPGSTGRGLLPPTSPCVPPPPSFRDPSRVPVTFARCISKEERKSLSSVSKRSLKEPGSAAAVPDVFTLALPLSVREEGNYVSFRFR